jgi:hypothetical protein
LFRCYNPHPICWAFQEPRPTALEEVYRDIDKKTPVIFILSVGADPSQILFRFATEMKYRERLRIISLGQGMGPKAARMIEARSLLRGSKRRDANHESHIPKTSGICVLILSTRCISQSSSITKQTERNKFSSNRILNLTPFTSLLHI